MIMSANRLTTGGWRAVVHHVAFRPLLGSVALNLIAPALLYRLATPYFPPGSLIPLAISALPPALALTYSLIRKGSVDFLGLFAIEGALVNIASLLLAHSERGALIGRSLQNIPLALIFLGSLLFTRPLVLHMARQLATGNDPSAAPEFDRAARDPANLRTYRVMTWGWAAALTLKSVGSLGLALTFAAKDYLVVAPLWDLVSDSALVTWSILYGRAKLGGQKIAGGTNSSTAKGTAS